MRIEISDTGIGIDPEDQQAIFDRFFRVENRVHTLEGTGLGLSIVRNIIEKHHTKIHLISEVSRYNFLVRLGGLSAETNTRDGKFLASGSNGGD